MQKKQTTLLDYSVTTMLNELNLQKFDTVIDKYRSNFKFKIDACENGIVQLHLCVCI